MYMYEELLGFLFACPVRGYNMNRHIADEHWSIHYPEVLICTCIIHAVYSLLTPQNECLLTYNHVWLQCMSSYIKVFILDDSCSMQPLFSFCSIQSTIVDVTLYELAQSRSASCNYKSGEY